MNWNPLLRATPRTKKSNAREDFYERLVEKISHTLNLWAIQLDMGDRALEQVVAIDDEDDEGL